MTGTAVPLPGPAARTERAPLGVIQGGPPTAWRALLLHGRRTAQTVHRFAKPVFAMMRAGVDALARKFAPSRAELHALEAVAASLTAQIAALRTEIKDIEERGRPQVPAGQALTLTLATRGMALKLARQGQKPAQIARLLGVPQGEVLLLLKVQRLQGVRMSPGEFEIPENRAVRSR